MVAEVGRKAPEFTMPSSAGGQVSLGEFAGKNVVVLYFYPKDMTPGCTQEACDFRDQSARLRELGAVVLGISPDPLKSHEKFIQQQSLNFPLLADVDHAVCEHYGVWVEKTRCGKKSMGVDRSTFVIGRDGKIARAWHQVKVAGHVEEVIAAVEELSVPK